MIPKIIHWCWLSKNEYPQMVKDCLDSWHKYLSDYEIRFWNTDNFDVSSTAWTQWAFENKKYAFASDYIRYYALYNFGGIYLDSDVEVLKSFNDLLQYDSFMGFEYMGLPEAAVIGAKKGTVWVKSCLEWYETAGIDRLNNIERMLAPRILKTNYENTMRMKLLDTDTIAQVDNHIILPFYYLSPKNFFSGKIIQKSETYAIHHFESAWMKQNIKTKIRRLIHAIIIKIFGRNIYNRILYSVRGFIHCSLNKVQKIDNKIQRYDGIKSVFENK